MNPFVHEFTVDLRSGAAYERARRPLSQGNAYADKLVVRVVDGRKDIALDGVGVSAKVIRYDGLTVPLIGAVEGGAACIVLDDAYYHFLISQARDKEKLSILSIPALILLKIKAYLNLREQYNPDKPHGSDGGKRNIRKHRNDVFFMLFSLEGDITCALSETLMSDVQLFIDFINADETAWQGVLTHLKHQYGETSLQGISRTSILARLKEIFQLL